MRKSTQIGRYSVALLLAFGLESGWSTAAAQNARPGQRRGLQGQGDLREGVSPAEVQRLFDAYVVMEAQQALELTGEQYPKFLVRVRALQDARRHGQAERFRLLRELRRLSQAAAADEGLLRDRLKALSQLDAQMARDVSQAMEGIDQVLDVRQQARFRLFEEQMERRKVDLLTRARQAGRQRAPPE